MANLNLAMAYLGLGGNLADPKSAMANALRALDAGNDVNVTAVSSVYKTPPWGKTDQPDFVNAVARIETALEPRALLARCLDIEQQLKRVRRERWGPRLIDIDILWYDGKSVDADGLVLPHPRMLARAFVLVPLAEIAPDFQLDGMSAKERAAAIDRQGIVKLQDTADWWRG